MSRYNPLTMFGTTLLFLVLAITLAGIAVLTFL